MKNMKKNYETKLFEPVLISFRCEKVDKIRFQDYCDKYGLNESAVLRRILKKFLKEVNE